MKMASHLDLLTRAVMATGGRVIEFGGGYGSTPVLNAICRAQNRLMITVENNEDWLAKVRTFGSDNHEFIFSPDLSYRPAGSFSLAFIDCDPTFHRDGIIEFMRDKADVIVIHDSQNHQQIIGTFKHQISTTFPAPRTTAVSDFFEVETWLK